LNGSKRKCRIAFRWVIASTSALGTFFTLSQSTSGERGQVLSLCG
jgi:hypothetical protein